MRIGIVPFLTGSGGGIYQYSLTMLHSLYELTIYAGEDQFIVYARQRNHSILESFASRGWILETPGSPAYRLKARLREMVNEGPYSETWNWFKRQLKFMGNRTDSRNITENLDLVRFDRGMSRWFNRRGTELMIYPVPNPLSFEVQIPYVMAVHDLQHRLQPEFPEVSTNGEWESREYLFRNGARYATLLLADSEVGKEDILNFYEPYGITPDRVKVLPFLPATYLTQDVPETERQRVREAYALPDRYLFYPAQFWPHKNHLRIVRAIALVDSEQRTKTPIVFCGSNSGSMRQRTFDDVMSLAVDLGIKDQIHYLGYVRDEDMSALYAEAMALVMPTFFGPTNIPFLEAWAFGCPVLTSDIRGIREQVGDAGVLADPRSVEAIADGICRLSQDSGLRRTLIERGRERLSAYTPEHYRNRLSEILEEAKMRVCSEKLDTTI